MIAAIFGVGVERETLRRISIEVQVRDGVDHERCKCFPSVPANASYSIRFFGLGCGEHLRNLVKVLIEYAPPHLRRAGVSPLAFLEALAAKGFSIEEVDGLTGKLLAVDLEQLSAVNSANLYLRLRDTIASSAAPGDGGAPVKNAGNSVVI